MKNRLLLHILTFVIYGIFLPGYPQATLQAQESFTDRYNISYITMDEGLPHNFIDDIYKDSKGFLWIAMAGGGLSRYDGYEFVNFATNTTRCKLKSNFIRKVAEDKFGRLWAVSEGGIDIISLSTMQSLPLLETEAVEKGLSHKPTSFVICDANGCIWLHCDHRLHRILFDEEGNIREIRSLEAPGLWKNELVFKDLDNEGSVWIGLEGKIYKVSAASQGGLKATPVAEWLKFNPETLFSDFIAKENEIWISTDKGLYRYNRNENIIKHYEHRYDDPHSLSQNFLTNLAVTGDKQLIVSSLKGLNIYNPIRDNFERIEDRFSNTGVNLMNSNFINCITIDGTLIWIGTETGGLNKLTTKRLSLQNYANDKENPHTLSPNPVNAIYEDREGTLWVGTVEGGLNRKEAGSDNFTHYTSEDGTLSHNSVSSIITDPQDRLWIGTWGGGIDLLNRKNPSQKLGTINSKSEGRYPIDFIGALTYDSINNGVWIGANRGIYFYDFKRQKLYSPLPGQAAKDINGCIGSIIDKEGNLWMGCLEGVYIIDLHSRTNDNLFTYRQLKYQLNDPTSGLIEKITCFCESKDGTLWLGSNGNGIYKRTTDAEGKETFTAYTTAQGLSNNSVRGILEDTQGYLWIATNNGLSQFSPSENRFINYTQQDGLNNTQFYWNASCRSAQEKMYFGNVSGLVAIDCELPVIASHSSPIHFTKLIIDNEEVLPGTEQLPTDISVTDEISMHERIKSFSLEFAALNYESDPAATYSYRLVGFDKEWIHLPHNRRFASYTNLSAGKYTLQVKYSPTNSNGDEQITELQITIRPYFYKTLWFTVLMIILFLLGIRQFYQWRIRHYKRQEEMLQRKVEQRTHKLNEQKLLLEKQTEELSKQNLMLKQQNERISHQKTQLAKMARKVQELTLDKIAFFTNITHEFRTPITLIIGPIERALKLSYNPQVIEQLHFVERNSKYLLSLVNQLMDFRKVESGKLEIVKHRNNFLKFVNELIIPFEVFAAERKIELKRYQRMKTPEIFYDEEAMQKVLTNLLSNAIKFTPNDGKVSVYIAQLPAQGRPGDTLYICVSDTGSGIPEDDINKVFNRFYQSKGQASYPMYGQSSSGIGLYLCKRIVQMLGGSIIARNNPKAGCSLRILLPLSEEETYVQANGHEHNLQPAVPNAPTMVETQHKDLCILIVEDNTDMRGYIKSILRGKYDTAEAANGMEAMNILASQNIDFIISDLMMPVMDGIEFSRKVKENIATSHIPFLMLTAKTSQETQIESYRIGVDEYLMKPFDETLLLTRIENILESRKRYQQKFATGMNIESLNIKDDSADKKFINRVMEVMKENYKNSYFEVSDFCEAIGASKTLLNQKLQNLVGQSAGQFIRNYRLNLAHDLILKMKDKKEMNIAEIAYEVGFNDPKYFTRCFTKVFKIKPSELLSPKA